MPLATRKYRGTARTARIDTGSAGSSERCLVVYCSRTTAVANMASTSQSLNTFSSYKNVSIIKLISLK